MPQEALQEAPAPRGVRVVTLRRLSVVKRSLIGHIKVESAANKKGDLAAALSFSIFQAAYAALVP
jgi:hypothetical protein